MPFPLIPLLIGLGAGGIKGAGDMAAEKRDRKVQAATTMWNPWTGMKAAEPRKADLLGAMMQGGMAGAMMGNSFGGEGVVGNGTGQELTAPFSNVQVPAPSTNTWAALSQSPLARFTRRGFEMDA